jgi:hypothetical protein
MYRILCESDGLVTAAKSRMEEQTDGQTDEGAFHINLSFLRSTEQLKVLNEAGNAN